MKRKLPILVLLLSLSTQFVYSQVSKSDATGQTLNASIATRNFVFTGGDFGGCTSLTEVEVDLTLTVTDNSGCAAGAFGVHQDIAVSLESPSGTVVHLVQDFAGILIGSPPIGITYQDATYPTIVNETTTYDDDAALAADDQTFFGNGSFRPHNPLSAFDGEDPTGTWILKVADGRNQGFPDFTCYIGATVRITCGATCTDPTVPTLTQSPATVCTGGTASLNISGTLNDATAWQVYSGSCGGTNIGSTTSGTFAIPGTISSPTTYYVRGEGGCVTPSSCGSLTITPQSLDDASFSYGAASYCVNAADPTPTITGLGGGTFSSTAGLSINASTGTIDVSASTPGTYTVTYTTAGSCPNSSNVAVTINALDDASFSYGAASYCVNAADPTPTITGLGGGTFSSTAGLSINASTGAIDVSASTPNTYTVTYTTSGTCPNSSNVAVTINALDDPSFSYGAASYCVNAADPTPTITGLGGGTFSSTAGLSINASTGAIDVSASTPNAYTVTYTTSGSCPNSSNVSVTINALDDPSFSYGAASYCVNAADPTPTITGLGGGTFSSTAGLSINASTGAIDVSASTPNTYTVTYTTSGTCPSSSNVAVTINALDDASFSYGAASYCTTDSDPTPTITGLGGGTFSSTAGLSINASTGAIDVSASTPNTYTVTYTTSGTCPNSSNVAVTINSAGATTFTALADLCVNAGVQTGLGSGTPTGGVYSGAGVTDDGNGMTYSFDPAAAGVGTHTITYALGGCFTSSNDNVEVFALPSTPSAITPLSVCPGNDVILTGTGSGTGDLVFYDNTLSEIGRVTMGGTATQTHNNGAMADGSYTFYVAEDNGNCVSATTMISVTVGDAVNPTITCPGNQTETVDGSCQVSLPDYTGLATASDNCDATPTITQSPAAGTIISSTTTVTLTATDASSNTASCTFDVNLNDATAPTAVCQNINAYLDGAGNVTITASDIDGGSTDNCGGVTLSASQTAFTCADIGANNVTLTVTDGNTNTDNCVAVVTVMDTISPVVTCPGNQTENPDASCNFTLPDYTGLVTATDNCAGSPVVSQSPVAGTVISGTTTVTMTANDGNGNTSTCTFDVVLNDATAPTAVCQNINAYLDGAGNTTIVASDLDGGSTDNCSGLTFSASQTAFTCADLGANNVTLTVTDGNANTDNCVAVVTVLDTISPIVVCQNINAYLDGTGNVTISASDIDNGSIDNCGSVTLTASQTAFTCADLGANTVTLTGNDGNGNTSQCVAVVTILDTISPVTTCPGNQTENVDGSCQVTLPDYTGLVTATDNCTAAPTVTQSPVAGTVISATTNVTMTSDDGNGNTSSCSFDVNLNDATAPTAVCQNINAYLDGAGNVTITPSDIDGGSTDNCGGVTLSASQTAFTCADMGANNVTLTVTDGNTNTDNCVAVVTVMDTISPVVTCPGNQTENPDASCNFTLPDYTGLVTATDNCSGAPTVTQSPTSGTVISGTTTITMTADDGNGNTSTCTFDVILNDATAPTAVCQNINTYLDGAGNATITGADLNGGSTDNCSGLTFSASQAIFTCADLGANNVTLTVTDGNANTDNCVAVVTVLDTVSPTAVCQNISVALDASGNATIVAADIDGGSTDNCSVASLSASQTAFTCADLGANNVTLTVIDGSGNTSTCVAIVTITDGTNPTAVCQNISIALDASGNATITGSDIDGGSTDNCSVATLSASQTTFTCADLGANNVTLTVTDGSGNTDNCVAVVTVTDGINPTAVCQDINVYLDGAGNASITASDIDGGSTDNCSVATLNASQTAFTCSDLGANNVTLTVTDGSSNTDNCVAVVTVLDTISPVVTCPGDQTENPDASCNFTLPDYTGLVTATDNCAGAPTITQSPAVGTVISAPTTIMMTADDGNGNTSICTFDVLFDDIIAPTITCSGDQNVDFSSNCDYTLIDFTGLATATDNCSGVVVTQSPAVGTVITGTTTITLTATDGVGNTADCSFDVIPADNMAPVVTCPADQNELVDGNCEYIIPDYTSMVTATDNCSSSITLTQSPVASTVVGVGSQTITITADDGNGNTADCSFTLNVTDNIAPTISCPSDQSDSFDDNCAFALLDYTTMATASDNCGIPTITQSPAAGTLVTSNTTITLTADDGNGNTADCSFNLTLSDTTRPVVECPSDETIYLDENCQVVLPDYTMSGNIFDNCDGSLTITQVPAAGTLYEVSELVDVTLTATDVSGNVDSCSFVITVDADENSGCVDNLVVSDLITPNGDGKNDQWIIHETSYIIGCQVIVYNRWGQQVFESENYDNTWEGTYQGEPLPDGAYYYVILCDGEVKYKGDLSILRLKK